MNSLDEKRARLARMRDYVLEHIQKMSQVKVNGPLDGSKRLPNNVNASFTAAEGESLLLMLDMRGVCASSGSACASGSLDPSHVLLSIGLPHEIAHCRTTRRPCATRWMRSCPPCASAARCGAHDFKM